MKVTDEMVKAARKAWGDHCATSATTLDDMLRAALEAALSHASGQDGEQCRAASVASGEVQDVIEGIPRALNLAHRLIMTGPKAAHVSASETHEISEWIEEAADALRALSRGVPEGE